LNIKKLFNPFSWFGNATFKEPEWWRQQLFSTPSVTGVHVDAENAMKSSAVYACVQILSDTIASLPLKMYQETSEGREIAKDHPLTMLFGAMPNDEQTSMELRQFIVQNLVMRGNSYSQIIRAGGKVRAIEPLLTKFMNVDRDSRNRLVFDYQETGNSTVFAKDRVWRIAGLSLNGVTGLSPIGYQRESVGLAMAMETQAGKQFANGAQIAGVLEYPHALDDEGIEKLRMQFQQTQSGVQNAHKPLILESGMKYSQIGMNNQDAQFLESRKAQTIEIARWFRVPPHMVGELDKATFSNIEHQSIEFVRDTIRPWLVRIEQSIIRDLLTQQERLKIFPSHSVEGLLRGDIKARYEAYGLAIRDGHMNRNEVRRLENRNKKDGLDEFLIPLNMTGATDRENDLNNAVINIIANKEIKTLKTEIDKKDESQFKQWVSGFYQRHKKEMTALCISDQKISQYIIERIEQLTTDPIKNIPFVIESIRSDLEKLTNE
jgi:HK97 family phage portal protein